MSVRMTRLGLGEWLLASACVLLLVDLFALNWFEYRARFHSTAAMLGQRVGANGWDSFEVIGPLALLVCVAGIAICWLAATRRSPALPIVLTTLLAPISFALMIIVAVRVLLDPPAMHLLQAGGANVIETRPGAYIGLAFSIAIFAGVYLTLRREGTAPGDAPPVIQTLSVEQSPTPTHP